MVKLEVVREGIGESREVLLNRRELVVDLGVVVGVGVVLLVCVTGHHGFPFGFEFEIASAMTHMSHAVQNTASRRGKDSECFPESFPRRIGVLRSTIAEVLPGSFAAVADLSTFDDVDDVFVGDVLVVVAFVRILVVRFVHVATAGHAADAVLERPVLLGHQPHFGVASELFAVVVEDFDQGIERHVCLSVWVNENRLCDDTHEPCGSNNLKPIPAAFLHVFAGLFACPTVPNVGVCRVLFHVGYFVACGGMNASVGDCGDQAEERRASVRGVRGVPLVCGLEDLAQAAVIHRVKGLHRVEVFGEKRAGAGRLLRVGDLEGFRQGHQTLDRLVIGFADLLGLVSVHRLEDLAKGSVGCCVLVVCCWPCLCLRFGKGFESFTR